MSRRHRPGGPLRATAERRRCHDRLWLSCCPQRGVGNGSATVGVLGVAWRSRSRPSRRPQLARWHRSPCRRPTRSRLSAAPRWRRHDHMTFAGTGARRCHVIMPGISLALSGSDTVMRVTDYPVGGVAVGHRHMLRSVIATLVIFGYGRPGVRVSVWYQFCAGGRAAPGPARGAASWRVPHAVRSGARNGGITGDPCHSMDQILRIRRPRIVPGRRRADPEVSYRSGRIFWAWFEWKPGWETLATCRVPERGAAGGQQAGRRGASGAPPQFDLILVPA